MMSFIRVNFIILSADVVADNDGDAFTYNYTEYTFTIKYISLFKDETYINAFETDINALSILMCLFECDELDME